MMAHKNRSLLVKRAKEVVVEVSESYFLFLFFSLDIYFISSGGGGGGGVFFPRLRGFWEEVRSFIPRLRFLLLLLFVLFVCLFVCLKWKLVLPH